MRSGDRPGKRLSGNEVARVSGKHGGWGKNVYIQKKGKSKVPFQKVERLVLLKWRKIVLAQR